jgi:hypothetical protein
LLSSTVRISAIISSGSRGDVVFIDQVKRSTRGFTVSSVCEILRLFEVLFAWPSLGRLLNRDDIFEKKLVRPEYGESPVVPPVPGISMPVLLRDRV